MLSEPQCHQFKMSVVSLPGGYNTVAHRCAINSTILYYTGSLQKRQQQLYSPCKSVKCKFKMFSSIQKLYEINGHNNCKTKQYTSNSQLLLHTKIWHTSSKK